MTTSIQSPSLLEKYDATAFTQRIFRREATTEPSPIDFGNLLDNAVTGTSSPLADLVADLNATRTQQAYGATYDASGTSSRTTANTVLIGYG